MATEALQKAEFGETQALAVIERAAPKDAASIVNYFESGELVGLALHVEETLDILRAYTGVVPQNDAEEAALVALIGRANKVEKGVELHRKRRLAPLLAETKAVREIYARFFDQLLAKLGLRGDAPQLIGAYRRAKADRLRREQEEIERQKREAAERQAAAERRAAAARTEQARERARAEAEAASMEIAGAEATAPRPMPTGVKTEDGSASFREEWAFEIVSPDLVPRAFCSPDEKKLRRAVEGGARDIPGVNIFTRDRMTRRV